VSSAVLDSSAVLAYLNGEPGSDVVQAGLTESLLGAVNLAEVASKLAQDGASSVQIDQIIAALACPIVDFDRDLAVHVGAMRPLTAKRGLSLGDRACLALAARTGLPVLTTDRAWSGLELGVDVRLIR
jgi:PIN domain nuclease of toxin-antitoxin system